MVRWEMSVIGKRQSKQGTREFVCTSECVCMSVCAHACVLERGESVCVCMCM